MSPNGLHVVGLGGTLREKSTSRFALEHALAAAQDAGASTELLDIRRLHLPFFEPGKRLDSYDANVVQLIEASRRADAMIWSSGAYHGTLTGVIKNALDFLELLSDDDHPYLSDRVIGIVTTAGGELAAVNAANAFVHVAHALRATTAPLLVAIPQARNQFDATGRVTEPKWATRLEKLGHLVVDLAARSRPIAPIEAAASPTVAQTQAA